MTTEEKIEYRRLELIRKSDFEIADGDPNIIGWEIKDILGERLGEVKDLLFNPSAMKVRYIVARLNAGGIFEETREVLIPIGLAELHESADLVFVPGITITQLQAAPEYNSEEFGPDHERAVLQAFRDEKDLLPGYDDERIYDHAHYDMQHFYHKRFPDRGRLK